jgi:general secretion pathway protein J
VRNQAGFTLLELLIAMTLMSMVLVLVYGGLRLATRSWDAGEQRAENLTEISLTQDFIRRQLQQSLSLFREDGTKGWVVAFAGEPRRVSLVAPLFAHLGLGGLYAIQLYAVDDGGVGQLRMRWYPYRPADPEGDRAGEETVLLEGVSEVQWAYFGLDPGAQDPHWRDRWQNSQQRPALVRLSLKWRGDPWPDLVAVVPD